MHLMTAKSTKKQQESRCAEAEVALQNVLLVTILAEKLLLFLYKFLNIQIITVMCTTKFEVQRH
jgi:hypothetical protein